MPDTDALITELRSAIGVDISQPGWSDSDCLLLLNRSWWELMNKIQYKAKENQSTFNTVVGTITYPLPVLTQAIQHVKVLFSDNVSVQELQKATLLDVETWTPTDLQGMPSFYYHRNSNIVIAPPPDQIYTVTIYLLTTLADLIAGTVPPIDVEWWEIILLGGIWRGYSKIGDLDRSNMVINQQTRLINTTILPEEIEIADTRNAGIQVGRPYVGKTLKKLWR